MNSQDPTWQLLSEIKSKARNFREKNTEFQGLEREFTFIQEDLLQKYKRSSTHKKHPADQGAIREEILREFLSCSGYLPPKYGVSKSSIRIVNQDGRHSDQIDIAFYDSLNTSALVNYSSLSFLAIENVYGIIQVKSKLSSRKNVIEGLKNVASFKRLEGAKDRFGILFAYDSSLKWTTLVDIFDDFICKNPPSEWTNFIVILNQGIILPCEKGYLPYGIRNHYFRNSDLMKISQPTVTGIPDASNTLLKFYLYIMDLLKIGAVAEPDLYQYVRLPFTVGEKAYRFTNGEIEEIGHCQKHGAYLREISRENLNKIREICFSSESIDMWALFEVGLGSNFIPTADEYQSAPVYLYNPENLSWTDILTLPNSIGLQCYSLSIEGKICMVPKYYSFRDLLISECPKCNYPANLFF